MPHCLLTICKSIQDYQIIASTIDVLFWKTQNNETDYIKVVRYNKEDINFYKKNYDQIYNAVETAHERISLIADYLQNKEDMPSQGLLFT